MKLLVATRQSQGTRGNDFSFTNEGEIVIFGSECDREAVDGKCGCKRSLVGIDSSKATTTLKVVEIDITLFDLTEKIYISLSNNGWVMSGKEKEMRAYSNMIACKLQSIADNFPVNAIIERRGEIFQQRELPQQEPTIVPIPRLKKKR